MKLSKLRRAKPEAVGQANQSRLITTNLKNGDVYDKGLFDSDLLKAWVTKNAGGSVLSYKVMPA